MRHKLYQRRIKERPQSVRDQGNNQEGRNIEKPRVKSKELFFIYLFIYLNAYLKKRPFLSKHA